MPWLIEWACEYCGYGDRTVAELVDHIQCPMCGEPVIPTFGDGRVRSLTDTEARQLKQTQWP